MEELKNFIRGQKIKDIRKKNKLTQKQLANLIGRTESSIAKYEKGLVNIPFDVMQNIADVFNIDIYNLMNTSIDNERNIAQDIEDSISAFRSYIKTLGYRIDSFDYILEGDEVSLIRSVLDHTIDLSELEQILIAKEKNESENISVECHGFYIYKGDKKAKILYSDFMQVVNDFSNYLKYKLRSYFDDNE